MAARFLWYPVFVLVKDLPFAGNESLFQDACGTKWRCVYSSTQGADNDTIEGRFEDIRRRVGGGN